MDLPKSPQPPSPPAKDSPPLGPLDLRPPPLSVPQESLGIAVSTLPSELVSPISPKTTVEDRRLPETHLPSTPKKRSLSNVKPNPVARTTDPSSQADTLQRQQQAKLQAAAVAHMQAQAQAEAHVRAAQEKARAQQARPIDNSPQTPAQKPPVPEKNEVSPQGSSLARALPLRSFSTESLLRSGPHEAPRSKIQAAASFDRGDLSQRKTQFYAEMFGPRTYDLTNARERVHRESVIVAEVKTNVIIRDEFLFLNDLSQHLAQRFQRPTSAVFVTLDHSACLLFAGSFDSAYILTITALPTQLQPTTNKRNAALTQSFLATALGVLPDRGIIRFNAIAEEAIAISGTTVYGQVERMQKSAAAIANPQGAALATSGSSASLTAPTSVLSPLQPAATLDVNTNQSSFSSNIDAHESRPGSAATNITTPDHHLDNPMHRCTSVQSQCPSHMQSEADSIAPAPSMAQRTRARTTSRSRPGKISILPKSASTPNSRLQTPTDSAMPYSAASSTSSFFHRSGRYRRDNSSNATMGQTYDILGGYGDRPQSRSFSTPSFHVGRWQRRHRERHESYQAYNADYDYPYDSQWRGHDLNPPALVPKKSSKRTGKRKSFLGFFSRS